VLHRLIMRLNEQLENGGFSPIVPYRGEETRQKFRILAASSEELVRNIRRERPEEHYSGDEDSYRP